MGCGSQEPQVDDDPALQRAQHDQVRVVSDIGRTFVRSTRDIPSGPAVPQAPLRGSAARGDLESRKDGSAAAQAMKAHMKLRMTTR